MNQSTDSAMIKTFGVYLVPMLEITELCNDARYEGAFLSELDGVCQVNVVFKSPDYGNLFISETSALFKKISGSPFYKNQTFLSEQNRRIFIFNIPETFEKDIYLFAAGMYDKFSQQFLDLVRKDYQFLSEPSDAILVG